VLGVGAIDIGAVVGFGVAGGVVGWGGVGHWFVLSVIDVARGSGVGRGEGAKLLKGNGR
jgi:hypothetical protein